MKKQSLLEKAVNRKMVRTTTVISKEDIELAIAWANDEVTITQCATAWGVRVSGAYLKLALSLRQAVQSR